MRHLLFSRRGNFIYACAMVPLMIWGCDPASQRHAQTGGQAGRPTPFQHDAFIEFAHAEKMAVSTAWKEWLIAQVQLCAEEGDADDFARGPHDLQHLCGKPHAVLSMADYIDLMPAAKATDFGGAAWQSYRYSPYYNSQGQMVRTTTVRESELARLWYGFHKIDADCDVVLQRVYANKDAYDLTWYEDPAVSRWDLLFYSFNDLFPSNSGLSHTVIFAYSESELQGIYVLSECYLDEMRLLE